MHLILLNLNHIINLGLGYVTTKKKKFKEYMCLNTY